MPAMTVDATTYPVRAIAKNHVPMSIAKRTWADTLVTTRPVAAATVLEWIVETSRLTEAQASALVTALTTAGTVTMAGDEFGSGITCQAYDIGWVSLTAQDKRSVTFTVREVTP